MALVKCKHCSARLREPQMNRHLQVCIVKRRADATEQRRADTLRYGKEQKRIDAEALAAVQGQLAAERADLETRERKVQQPPTSKKGTKR